MSYQIDLSRKLQSSCEATKIQRTDTTQYEIRRKNCNIKIAKKIYAMGGKNQKNKWEKTKINKPNIIVALSLNHPS